MQHVKNFIYGLIIGIANIIPGVSGGTMAVVLNIYDRILFAISLKNLRSNAGFLGALGIGMIVGIFAFSRVITYLFETFSVVTNFCFIGLVLGSVPMIFKRAKGNGIARKNWIPFSIALMFMVAVTIIGKIPEMAGEGLSFDLSELPIYMIIAWLFIATFVSTIGMILPGISGSFLLLLFGVYTIIMKAISEINFIILLPVGAGVVLGGLVGVKFIKILLRDHPQALYFSILGLVLGSILVIYPGVGNGTEFAIALVGMSICASISYWFGNRE